MQDEWWLSDQVDESRFGTRDVDAAWEIRDLHALRAFSEFSKPEIRQLAREFLDEYGQEVTLWEPSV